MTVAVSLSLPEGVILGVDSAVTLGSSKGVLKVFENAKKLFQLSEKPIGIACFGTASIGNRTIGSYVREFELLNPNNVVSQPSTVKVVVEELRRFFIQKYQTHIVPIIEKKLEKNLKKYQMIKNQFWDWRSEVFRMELISQKYGRY